MLTLLAAFAIAISGAIGVYHAGVELKIFEGITTCTTTTAGASNAELLEKLMRVPLIRWLLVLVHFRRVTLVQVCRP